MLALKLLAGALLCFGTIYFVRTWYEGASLGYEKKCLVSHIRHAKLATYSLLVCAACTEVVLLYQQQGWTVGYLILAIATIGLLMLIVHIATGLRYPTTHAALGAVFSVILLMCFVCVTITALIN